MGQLYFLINLHIKQESLVIWPNDLVSQIKRDYLLYMRGPNWEARSNLLLRWAITTPNICDGSRFHDYKGVQ